MFPENKQKKEKYLLRKNRRKFSFFLYIIFAEAIFTSQCLVALILLRVLQGIYIDFLHSH